MSLAWKQEFRLAVEERFDWPALLRASSHGENASAQSPAAAAPPALEIFTLSQDSSSQSPEAAFDWIAQLLDLHVPAPPLTGVPLHTPTLPTAPAAATEVAPAADAGDVGPVAIELTADTMAKLDAFLPEVRDMVHEAIAPAFAASSPLASIAMLLPDVPSLAPPSIFPI